MSDRNSYIPDWAPGDGGDVFAVRVKKGIQGHPDEKNIPPGTRKKRSELTVDEYVNGVLKNDKTVLARAVTLVESNAREHYEKAREVLTRLLPYSGRSLRVGITGVPGGGKSTLIETLGCFLIDKGYKVAVLAVDPSSTVTRGSILGDKTRMEKLSRCPGCFIRPSPSGGTPGGVARKTRETILVCEAAGYDPILIETIGVGQSEIAVRSMVDFFLLILIAGAGDELQGIKRGVMESADALAVNKADGPDKAAALRARNEYATALKYLAPATKGWQTKAYTCSALTGEGIPELWTVIGAFEETTKRTGVFRERRQRQSIDWFFSMIGNHLEENFYGNPSVQKQLPGIKARLLKGDLLPTAAVGSLLDAYRLSGK